MNLEALVDCLSRKPCLGQFISPLSGGNDHQRIRSHSKEALAPRGKTSRYIKVQQHIFNLDSEPKRLREVTGNLVLGPEARLFL